MQVVTQPADQGFSKNPLPYKFKVTDANGDLYRALGVRSDLTMNAQGFDTDDILSIDFVEPNGAPLSISFIAKDSPSASAPDEIQSRTGQTISLSYYQGIAAKMSLHPRLQSIIQVTAKIQAGNYTLVAEAMELNESYIITWDVSDVDSSSNPVVVDHEFILNEIPADLRVELDLFVESDYQSEIFNKVGSFSVAPNALGEVSYDVSDVLHRELVAREPIEINPSVLTITKANTLLRYYARYRLSFVGATTAWSFGQTKTCYMGGFAQNQISGANFFAARDATSSLFTWKPDRTTVGKNQPQYLTWYNYTNEDVTIALEIIKRPLTGSLETSYKYNTGTALTIAPGELAFIPCGFSQLGLSDAYSYTVRIFDRAFFDSQQAIPTYLSPGRTYFIDDYFHREERYLLYRNGLGGWESWRSVGDFEQSMEADKQTFERVTGQNLTANTAEIMTFTNNFQTLFTYRSPYVNTFELNAMQEIILSNQILEALSDNYIPLVVSSDSMKVYDSADFLHKMRLTAQPALRPVNYSNDTLPLAPTTDGGWQIADGGFWRTIFGKPWKIT